MIVSGNVSRPNLFEIELKNNKRSIFYTNKLLLVYPLVIDEAVIESAVKKESLPHTFRSISHAVEIKDEERYSVVMVIFPITRQFIVKVGAFNADGHNPKIFCISGEIELRYVEFWMKSLKRDDQQPQVITSNKLSGWSNIEEIKREILEVELFYERRFEMLGPVLSSPYDNTNIAAINMMGTLLVERRKEVDELRKLLN